MEDHLLDIEKEQMSPVIPVVTIGLLVLFALGFLYQLVTFLL